MGNIRLWQGRKRTGLTSGFAMHLSSDGASLSVRDEEQRPVHFIDFERSDERLAELPLDRYTGGGIGDEMLLDLFAAAAATGENVRLCAGKSAPGIRPNFILSISLERNLLFAWDEKGVPVRFTDLKRGEEYDALPLERYTGGGHPGVPFLRLLAAMAGFGLEYATFRDTKIRCRCEVGRMDLYRVTDPGKPPTRIITLGGSSWQRAVLAHRLGR